MKKIYKRLSLLLNRKNIYLIRGLVFLGRKTAISFDKLDYVRIATLELLAHEIMEAGLTGHIAELGVYKGDFAKYVNEVFPHKTFFLFDTFTGFNEDDLEKESRLNPGIGRQDFSDTSVDSVLAKMKHPEKCIVRKGYFPDTIGDLKDHQFCFVSIDADLYEPILKGLKIFYEKLVPGGSILVHDYNNSGYPGCKKAVREFCAEQNIPYVPLPDIGGSVVIRKP
jgi:O-methyltransferase